MHALCTPRRYKHNKPDAPDDASGGRYKHNKPLRHVHRRGTGYRAKKYPIRREPHGVCNERGASPYSVVGVEVSAPRIPAIVIVTSPMNIEPNDCNGVKSAFPAYPIKKTATVANKRAKNFRATFPMITTCFD